MKFATSSLITPQELNGLRINKIIKTKNELPRPKGRGITKLKMSKIIKLSRSLTSKRGLALRTKGILKVNKGK